MRQPRSSDRKYQTRHGWDRNRYEADMRDWESEQAAKRAAREQARQNQHRGHEVKAVLGTDGRTQNYYNGTAKDGSYQADGKGHSHIGADSNGTVDYERDHGKR